jgi:hypothetical protein
VETGGGPNAAHGGAPKRRRSWPNAERQPVRAGSGEVLDMVFELPDGEFKTGHVSVGYPPSKEPGVYRYLPYLET